LVFIRVATVTAACAFALLWVVYDRVYERGGDRPVAWQDLTRQLGPLEFPRPTGRVYRRREDLQRYLVAIMPGRAPKAPPIDFRRREALLVAAGPRSSTGYELRIVSVREERGRIVVKLKELAPSLHDPVAARLTYPYRLLTFPRSGKRVYLDWEGRP
jgi:PrcB C-terminal